MKIILFVFHKDNTPMYESEVTCWDPIVADGLKRRMQEISERNPGSYWRFGVMYEDGDGQFCENVPLWKSKLAAGIIQSGSQAELARQVEEGRGSKGKNFLH